MQTIGILGSGVVGDALAKGFLARGHSVVRGSREPGKLADWAAKAGPGASTATFADAAKSADVVVLAVKGTVAESLVRELGEAVLSGKVVIDATNPLAEAAPDQGVLRFFTGPNESLMERLQAAVPSARFVKAFSCVGNAYMVDPVLPGGPPTMFIAGDDAAAKETVSAILRAFGWDVMDMGAAPSARAIEPLCMLWCIPGLRGQGWSHAFKLLRA